jgi:hypothetical protein
LLPPPIPLPSGCAARAGALLARVEGVPPRWHADVRL